MKFILKDWCGVAENIKFNNNNIYKILSTYVPKGVCLKTMDQYASFS